MSGWGQKAKYSLGVDVFRFAPESGLKSDIAPCPKGAMKRLVQRNKFRKFRPAMRSPRRGYRSHCAASRIDRLGQKRFRAILKRLTLGFRIAVGSDHDDRNIRPNGLCLGKQLKAAHPRHVDVGKDQN
jgi:hypothetical protein